MYILWTLLQGCANVGWLNRTYLQQLCTSTRCSSEVIDDRDEWWES